MKILLRLFINKIFWGILLGACLLVFTFPESSISDAKLILIPQIIGALLAAQLAIFAIITVILSGKKALPQKGDNSQGFIELFFETIKGHIFVVTFSLLTSVVVLFVDVSKFTCIFPYFIATNWTNYHIIAYFEMVSLFLTGYSVYEYIDIVFLLLREHSNSKHEMMTEE